MTCMEEEDVLTTLTGPEMRVVQAWVNEALREKGVHINRNNGTQNLDPEREVEEAIEAWENMTPKQRANLINEEASRS